MTIGRSDTEQPARSGGPTRYADLPWQTLEATKERYLPFSEFRRLGFLARWNCFLGADGYQMPFIYAGRDYDAEPVGFDIKGHGHNFQLPVIDPMVTAAFDNFQDFARPDFSAEERREIRRLRAVGPLEGRRP